ncbi:MAG: GNAT family N-acetyltransferase [Clostridia bacterium]|nr:GNAT family N-acetyltransferase [Clostridia bacterium]
MNIRIATEADLPRVNELRAQVSELHAAARPDIFCPSFPDFLADFIHTIHGEESKHILVAERDGKIVAFAVLAEIETLEKPHKPARRYVEVDEFGVDAACHRQGIGRIFFGAIKDFARTRGFDRIELNMWEFNENALKFYEAIGFSTYRRYMECTID